MILSPTTSEEVINACNEDALLHSVFRRFGVSSTYMFKHDMLNVVLCFGVGKYILLLENVQCRASKLILGFMEFSNEERLT